MDEGLFGDDGKQASVHCDAIRECRVYGKEPIWLQKQQIEEQYRQFVTAQCLPEEYEVSARESQPRTQSKVQSLLTTLSPTF